MQRYEDYSRLQRGGATISGKEAIVSVIEATIVGVIVNDFSIKTTLCISASVYLFDF